MTLVELVKNIFWSEKKFHNIFQEKIHLGRYLSSKSMSKVVEIGRRMVSNIKAKIVGGRYLGLIYSL